MQLTNKHPKYTFINDNVYYFSKAVPSDLQHHYCKPRVVISLKTKSSHRAATASRIMLSKLEDYWLGLRLKDIEVPAAHLLKLFGPLTTTQKITINVVFPGAL